MYHFPITVLMIGNRSAGIGDIVPNDKIIFFMYYHWRAGSCLQYFGTWQSVCGGTIHHK